MKKSILIVVLTFSVSMVFGQKQKIGHVNTTEIMESMYIKDSIQFKLMEFRKQLEKESIYLQQELQEREHGLQKLKDSISEESFNNLVQRLQQDYSEFQTVTLPNMQKRFQLKELDLVKPIEEKITKAIEKIAKENSFTYIISKETALFAGGDDITKLVRLELGLPEEAEPLPLNGGIQSQFGY
ncbi:MAG: hypothetical protein CMP67_08505 [Flavobacteriales bacterium]|nr:hypothetical protein [Flavobacteriales bacterium]|tara:strand:+ start:164 stop:715 length:552 start_codon:yes stop_codon:yes gene_type:complete